ncbi:MAG: general secretion pathway protein GspK [Phycisphaerae bacterium]
MNRANNRNASILIVAIWIVLLLASIVIVIARKLRVQQLITSNNEAIVKCEAIVSGALNYSLAALTSGNADSDDFEAVKVGEGYFWLIKPELADSDTLSYGLVDEAGKINLNSASYDMLAKLPGMTSELAYSIIDWRDGDHEISTGGAESEYYLLLPDGYTCKDAPLESVEEVLLIKGAEVSMLYGEDANRNGVLDDNENDGEESLPSDDSNSILDEGFYNYVTVSSYEPAETGSNAPINVNDRTARPRLTNMLIEQLGEERTYEVLPAINLKYNYISVMDFYYTSQLESDEFAPMLYRLSISDAERQGLVNVNSAPGSVLLCLPGLEQTDVDMLLEYRSDNTPDGDSYLWVTEVLDREKVLLIANFITGRSLQFSADILAATANGRAFRRYQFIIDNAGSEPKVLMRKPLSNLPWPLDMEVLEKLRDGTFETENLM